MKWNWTDPKCSCTTYIIIIWMEWMTEWMNDWMNEWMKLTINAFGTQKNISLFEWMNEWTNEWMKWIWP